MGITSFYFLCFYALILGVYYIVPKKTQWMFLLFVSVCYFLTAGELWLIIYPFVSVILTYTGALVIERVKEQKAKRFVLSLIVVFSVLILFALKYVNFGIYTYNALANRLGFSDHFLQVFQFMIPLGISFYTLSLLGYLFDVYYEISKPQESFFKFALFGFYFPTIISGPIIRYRDVEGQFYVGHRFDYRQVTFGMQRMVWGFFKTLVISERMAVIVNTVYGDYRTYSGMYIVIATICFAFQLYANFSGAIDIVLGISQTFGITIEENFKTPFFSKTMQEFWRRWHITLGAWLKDYLFFPILRTKFFTNLPKQLKTKLGKKRAKQATTFTAMFILWFTVGLWHGGAWKFIIGSGILHWCYIVGGELLEPLWKKMRVFFHVNIESRAFICFQRIRTFLLVCSGFLFFRADSATSAFHMYGSIFTMNNMHILWDGSLFTLGLDVIEWAIVTASLGILYVISRLQQKICIRERLEAMNIIIRWAVLFALLFYTILFGYYGPGFSASEFIYQGF